MRHASLGDWYRAEVLPSLTPESLWPRAFERRDRLWGWRIAVCPLCGESASGRRISACPQRLAWKCHQCDAGGDALAWINGGETPRGSAFRETVEKAARLAGCTIPDRFEQWPARRTYKPATRPQHSAPASSTPDVPASGRDPKAQALWAASNTAEGTPAADYLQRRLAWPVGLDGWTLPSAVRWSAPAAVHAAYGWTLPDSAAGCIAFRFAEPDGKCRAVQLEALTAQGQRLETRWRRCGGRKAGLRFVACDLPGGRIHVGEGEVTALALAVQCHALGRGMAVGCGGAAGLTSSACTDPEERGVVIHTDRDGAGRQAAWTLRRALQAVGRECNAAGLAALAQDGADAADTLADEVDERVAIRELEGGLNPSAALEGAWRDVLGGLRTGRLQL